MIKSFLLFFLLLMVLSCFDSQAQTFTGAGGPILDDGSHNFYSCFVSGVTPTVMDTSYGLETVCINLTHTWDDDLVMWLITPDGTEFELASHNGGDGDNYTNTCFNYDASTSINDGSPPFTGFFKPEGFMSIVNKGQDPNGEWKLHILDTWAWADQGDVLDWSLTFGDNPAVPFPFHFANLPLVIIATPGITIPDEPKITANMKIIDNPGMPNHPTDSPNVYKGLIGIELRGASSLSMPKRSFTLETRNSDGSSNDVSLLGMPSNDDWVLISNYADKSLLRNYLTYFLYRKMGHWAPRMVFCELLIDGEYQGIYVLGEKIKRGPNRVNISSISPQDTVGTELTGGYIFKLDWEDSGDVGWYSDFPAINNTNNLKYLFDYPKVGNIQMSQIVYMKAYADSFEYAMNSPAFADTAEGYRKYVEEDSFIDFIILSEYTKNLDSYRLSTFFSKDKEGKITAGPPWDFDLGWGNGNFMEAYLPSGWNYLVQQQYSDQCPFWWQRFFEDTLFQNRLKCRWNELRENILNPFLVKAELDSLSDIVGISTNLNFTKWPILGVWVWPNPVPIPDTYEGEIEKLKDWVDLRTTWLDNHWTGHCSSTEIREMNPLAGSGMAIYPNPNSGRFRWTSFLQDPCGTLEISNIDGNRIKTLQADQTSLEVNLDLRPGVYLLRYITPSRVFTTRFIIGY